MMKTNHYVLMKNEDGTITGLGPYDTFGEAAEIAYLSSGEVVRTAVPCNQYGCPLNYAGLVEDEQYESPGYPAPTLGEIHE